MILAEPGARQLQEALELRAQGAPLEQATGLNPASDSLERMVLAAEAVGRLPAREAPAHSRTVVRERFLQEAGRRRHSWVHTSARMRHRVARHPAPTHHGRWIAVLGLGMVLAVIVGTVLSVAAMTAAPDSALYPVRLGGERAWLAINRDPVTKAQIRTDIANQRLNDAETTAAKGEADKAVEAMSAYYADLRSAGSSLAAQPRTSARWKATRNNFAKAESRPIDLVLRDLERTHHPAQAQQVVAMQKRFAQERQYLDKDLSVPAQARPEALPVQGASQASGPTP